MSTSSFGSFDLSTDMKRAIRRAGETQIGFQDGRVTARGHHSVIAERSIHTKDTHILRYLDLICGLASCSGVRKATMFSGGRGPPVWKVEKMTKFIFPNQLSQHEACVSVRDFGPRSQFFCITAGIPFLVYRSRRSETRKELLFQ